MQSSEDLAARPAHPRLCPFPERDPVLRAARWSLGCDDLRQSAPVRSGAAVVWYDGATGAREAQPGPRCLNATSLLPLPAGDQLFVVIAGKLYRVGARDKAPTPVTIQAAPGWRFSHLLALSRRPGPLTILASMVTHRSGEPERDLWLFRVRGHTATGAPFTDSSALDSPRAFIAQFAVPRCMEGYRDCVVIVRASGRPSVVGVESRRGQPIQPTRLPGANSFVDAAWVRSGQGLVVLETGLCP